MNKDYLKEAYLRIKNKLGRPPSKKEFKNLTNINEYNIVKTYHSFSNLVTEMGDIPKTWGQKPLSEEEYIISYGKMIRMLNKIPTTTDWLYYNWKPSLRNFLNKFKVKNWSKINLIFFEFARNKNEWNDIIHLIPKEEFKSSFPISESEECYVYLMKDKSNFHKIGISSEPEWRERTLQSQQPNIKLIAAKKYVNRRIAANIEKARMNHIHIKEIEVNGFNLMMKIFTK